MVAQISQMHGCMALPRICLQCDVKNVADSLKFLDAESFSSNNVSNSPESFADVPRSLVSSLEENKVIQGKRKKGKRKRIHKEDLLLLTKIGRNNTKPLKAPAIPEMSSFELL